MQQLQEAGERFRCINGLLWVVFGLGVLKCTTLSLRFLALIFDLFLLPAVNFDKYGAKVVNTVLSLVQVTVLVKNLLDKWRNVASTWY